MGSDLTIYYGQDIVITKKSSKDYVILRFQSPLRTKDLKLLKVHDKSFENTFTKAGSVHSFLTRNASDGQHKDADHGRAGILMARTDVKLRSSKISMSQVFVT